MQGGGKPGARSALDTKEINGKEGGRGNGKICNGHRKRRESTMAKSTVPTTEKREATMLKPVIATKERKGKTNDQICDGHHEKKVKNLLWPPWKESEE